MFEIEANKDRKNTQALLLVAKLYKNFNLQHKGSKEKLKFSSKLVKNSPLDILKMRCRQGIKNKLI